MFVAEVVLDGRSMSLAPNVSEIFMLAAKMPGVRTMSFYKCDISEPDPYTTIRTLPASLQRIDLSGCNIAEGAFQQLLTEFTGGALCLMDITVRRPRSKGEAPWIPDQYFFSTIQKLDITDVYIDYVKDYDSPFTPAPDINLRSPILSICHDYLKTLGIGINLDNKSELDGLNTFLRAKSSCLEHLMLNYSWRYRTPNFSEHISSILLQAYR